MIHFCSFPPQVTEEVLSVLRLLRPLTEPASTQPEPSRGENNLDDALVQLQNVARQLAISHTKQVKAPCPYILQSQGEFILVGMLPGGMFALHILVEIVLKEAQRT